MEAAIWSVVTFMASTEQLLRVAVVSAWHRSCAIYTCLPGLNSTQDNEISYNVCILAFVLFVWLGTGISLVRGPVDVAWIDDPKPDWGPNKSISCKLYFMIY